MPHGYLPGVSFLGFERDSGSGAASEFIAHNHECLYSANFYLQFYEIRAKSLTLKVMTLFKLV